MAGLFFPRTLTGWLTLLGVVCFLATELMAPQPQYFLLIPFGATIFLFAWAIGRAVRYGSGIRVAAAVLGTVAGLYLIAVSTAFLAFLAGGGSGFAATYSYPYLGGIGSAEAALVAATLWLLVGVPYRAFKVELDRRGDGTAQRVLVGLVTTVSCVLTGIYFFLLHYSNGPLRKIDTGQLVVGIVAPYYRSFARACWRRGIAGLLNPKDLIERWRNAVVEIRMAPHQLAKSETPPSSDGGSPTLKPD
jgi:uncharacterized membrane protein